MKVRDRGLSTLRRRSRTGPGVFGFGQRQGGGEGLGGVMKGGWDAASGSCCCAEQKKGGPHRGSQPFICSFFLLSDVVLLDMAADSAEKGTAYC